MSSNGHAEVSGTFRERPDQGNILHFFMKTDQTFLLPVVQGIDELKKTYGGMEGVKR